MLELAVFLCGAAVMAIELVASRILAPYLGTSLVVWTGLIGVILASLAAGAYFGGRLADRRPSPRLLSGLVLVAGLLTGLCAASKIFLLDFLQAVSPGPKAAILTATLVLFAPPAVLLGMVAPFAVRLRLASTATAGATAGRLYALSTLGSIVGTFVTGFVLIAHLGGALLLVCLGGLQVLAALCIAREDAKAKAAAAGALLLAGLGLWAYDGALAGMDIHDIDTPLSRLLVHPSQDPKTGRPTRVLSTSPKRMQSAMYTDAVDPLELALTYTRFLTLTLETVPGPRRMLVLGGGAYSFPRHALARDPELRLDVVELDPGVTETAKRFFSLAPDPRLTILHEDARVTVNRRGGPYDVIILDTFDTHYSIPFHLTTREALDNMRASLTGDGLLVINTIAALEGPGSRFLWALTATARSVFPMVRLYPLVAPSGGETVQNVMLVAGANPSGPSWDPTDPDLARFLASEWTRPVPAADILTDDFAPVETMSLALW